LIADMDALNMRAMINSPVNGSFGERSIKMAQGFKAFNKDRFPGSMTNLDFNGANDPDYAAKVASQLEKDIQGGAVGLKLHKAFGMGVRDAQGNRVHVDDPRFDKAFEVAAKYKIPVLIHTADPKALFDPFDKDNERWLELKQRPGRGNTKEPDIKWEDIMGEQHRLFAKHPKTTFIAAHFGWLAHDLGRLGALLDKMPNVNVEIAAILGELGRQPRTARKFFIKYQDRILFGKDTYRPEEYAFYFRVLETEDEYFDNIRRYHGLWKLYGLALPDDVLKKIYYKNAIRLFHLSDAGYPK
jgi:predicted TIM-barrel fold metal-dependent hydrolase